MCSKFFLIAYIITHQSRSHVTILRCNNDKTQKQIVACCLSDEQRQKDVEKFVLDKKGPWIEQKRKQFFE